LYNTQRFFSALEIKTKQQVAHRRFDTCFTAFLVQNDMKDSFSAIGKSGESLACIRRVYLQKETDSMSLICREKTS